jgi:phage shock protein PspC (stress-responsive transcriptional regulator)
MVQYDAVAHPGGMSEHTVEPSAVKRLERSRSDRMLAGVSGGLARYFDMHPAFFRVGFVVLTLIGGAGIIIYLAAALVIPDEGHEDSVAAEVLKQRSDRIWPLIGLGLVAVAAFVLLSRATFWPHGDAAWILLLLAGGVILWLTRREPPRPAPAPAPTAVMSPAAPEADTFPAAPEAEAETVPIQAVAAEDSRRVRRLGRAIGITFAALIAALLIAAAVFAATLPVHLSHGIGDETYFVSDASSLQDSYELGIGDLTLDLSELQLPVGTTNIKTRVDIGRTTVIVPRDAAVQAIGEAGFGEVRLLGNETDGRDADLAFHQTGTRTLVLDSRVGAGQVVVVRALR